MNKHEDLEMCVVISGTAPIDLEKCKIVKLLDVENVPAEQKVDLKKSVSVLCLLFYMMIFC